MGPRRYLCRKPQRLLQFVVEITHLEEMTTVIAELRDSLDD